MTILNPLLWRIQKEVINIQFISQHFEFIKKSAELKELKIAVLILDVLFVTEKKNLRKSILYITNIKSYTCFIIWFIHIFHFLSSYCICFEF